MGVKVDLTGIRAKVSPQAMKRGRYALGNQAMADMNPYNRKSLHDRAIVSHLKKKCTGFLDQCDNFL